MASKILLLTILLWPTLIFGVDSQGGYIYLAHGTHSCGKFIDAVNEGNNKNNWIKWNYYQAYTFGYLTGFNQFVEDTVDILGKTDIDGVMAYIEKYCRENPLEAYQQANKSVVKKLYPDRKK